MLLNWRRLLQRKINYTMALEDVYYQLEGMFSNPGAVLVAFALLFFIIIFEVLTKVPQFRAQKGLAILISFIIALIGIYYINDVYYWVLTFNVFLILVVIVIVFFILRAFFRFNKKQFGLYK